jgi:cobalt/nickel transport system permease protein
MHHLSVDTYAALESPLHRLDARVKLAAALAWTAGAVSEGRLEIAGLLPYLVPPLALLLVSGVPAGFVLKRVLVVSPFVLVLAAVTALFEPGAAAVAAGPWRQTVPAGLVAGASILLKFLVSALALLLLATTTRLSRLAGAMSALGMPRLLAMQVTILYRYLFLVVDEFERRKRAAAARTVGTVGAGAGARAAGSHLAGLFARSLERAEHVSQAMAARGFDGTLPRAPGGRLRAADVAFLFAALALAAGLRLRGFWIGEPW